MEAMDKVNHADNLGIQTLRSSNKSVPLQHTAVITDTLIMFSLLFDLHSAVKPSAFVHFLSYKPV